MPHVPRFALALAVVTTIAAAGAPALADRYVALGDSYSSGLGAGGGYSGGECRRSPLAFPAIVARELGRTKLAFAACAGARTTDVLARQLGTLTANTALVTITAGGNDAGFAEVLAECGRPAWLSDCAGRVAASLALLNGGLRARLDDLFARIRVLAPRALAIALGYPRLFGDRDCDLLTWFDRDDRARLNAAADALAETIRSRAVAHGLVFEDAAAAFAGHLSCAHSPWLNGLSLPLAGSFHPNAAGQRDGYARLVRTAIARAIP